MVEHFRRGVLKNNEKKGIIINVAQKIFSKYGLIKTTVDEIAKAARMGKASLYHYFRSKEDIYKEVVEKENEVLMTKIRDAVSREEHPAKQLKMYVTVRMKYLNELANIHSALKDDYLDHYAFIEKIRDRNFREEIETVKNILSDGVKNGIFKIRDIGLTSFSIISALKGLEYPWAVETDLPKVEKNIDKLMEILFNGIVKR